MSPARNRSLQVLISLAVAGFVGLIAYYAFYGEERETALIGEPTTTRAALARIEAESRGRVQEPPIQAAPRSSEKRPAADRMVEDAVPVPPDGYSFVSYHGEMSRARIEREVATGDKPWGPDLDWLEAATSIERLAEQASAAGRDWTFGWIRLAGDAKVDDLAVLLPDLGAAAIGSSGNLIRVRLPGDPVLLQEIAALPEVAGLGAVPPERKLPETLIREALETAPQELAPVFVTLMPDDPDGRWRQALEDLGAVVGWYDPDLRVYPVNVAYGQLRTLAATDYVLAIEPVGTVRPAHDTAVPAMGADALRVYDGSPGIFSGVGGATVPIGVMDTGLNINHLDIESNRESICGADLSGSVFLGLPFSGESEDLWIDEEGHGTHVTGTMIGNGTVQRRFAGMAPSVRDIRFAKVLDSSGMGDLTALVRGMDFLAKATECAEAGRTPVPVKPLIVNMSLADSSRRHRGKSVAERKLDSIVWGHRQLYVVAQSNEGDRGFSDLAAAKSSLSVGATLDGGDVAVFSSHGPTADGRLAPQVVATGVRVHSTIGGGSRNGYEAYDGTSMSSPAVAGVAALLMDAVPEHREQPALARARLMAGAIRPEPWLEDLTSFPLTNSDGPGSLQVQYGLGKVSARTSVLNRDEPDGWVGGGAVAQLQAGESAYQDIEVPEGASRLDLVMTWDEPPADAIASTVLNDLDLWLDRDGDCGTGACGEQVSASRVDNVEWIIVRNPEPGVYRAKVVARRVYTAAPRAALAWTVIRGASTPTLMIEADRPLLAHGEEQELTLTVTADEYVAAGSRLRVNCRDSDDASGCDGIRIHTRFAGREDGIPVELSEEVELPILSDDEPGAGPPSPMGSSIPLGEIAGGETQEVRFFISSAAEGGTARLYFTASAWNAKGASVSVGVGTGSSDRDEIAQPPPNDDFVAAAVLAGEQGFHTVDLLLATPEPGEPLFTARRGRPAGSAWYEWTAPADGAARFSLHPSGDLGNRQGERISVFRGDAIAGLEPVVSDLGGVLFFADEGVSYRVQVSHLGQGTVVDLHWSQGDRPANDDFDRATGLEGDGGTVLGNSQGATLEAGEWFAGVAGTTWYRWTAPSDGWWQFRSEEPRRVLVFEGDGISALRLVSRLPDASVLFPAGAGKEYRIAVAEPGLDTAGGPYELEWSPAEVPADNDQIAGAESIESVPSSQVSIGLDSESTVEPGEPPQTGVRTRWWVWEAPEDGRYTWRIEDASTGRRLRVTVFSGPSTDDLHLAARTRPHAVPADFVLQAVGGQRYWIAAGFPPEDPAAYALSEVSTNVVWGPTPVNDDLANATVLEEASGSVSQSTRFASMERGERSALLGHSSLWWTYEAPASGWYRFWLEDPDSPWVLAVYKEDGDGFGGLDFVRSSYPPEGIEPDAVEVVFQAEQGARYTIRMGARDRGSAGDKPSFTEPREPGEPGDRGTGPGGMGPGDTPDGEFTLNWDETEPPVWLRYAGGPGDGDRFADGIPVPLRGPSSLALNDRGTALYAASELGLQVFGRDLKTGRLALTQFLEGDEWAGLEDSSLIWDPNRSELYAHQCGVWRSFIPVDASQHELLDAGTMTVAGDLPEAAECDSGVIGDVFLSDEGAFLTAVVPSLDRLQVLSLEMPGQLGHVQTLSIPGLKRALISNGGNHVYAGTDHALLVLERDATTGRITEPTEDGENLFVDLAALAISDDDQFLFVFHGNGEITTAFHLEEAPSDPQPLATLTPAWTRFLPPRFPVKEAENRCDLAAARRGAPAVDVFCTDRTFSVQWRPEPGELGLTDHVSQSQPDRFDNPLPAFGAARSLATSPDGRHAYVDTEYEGILVFERVGVGADPFVLEDGSEWMSGSPGEVTFGSVSTAGCIEVENVVIEEARYAVVYSQWQTRATPDAEWSDVEGTAREGQVCAYTPSRPGEYRLVAKLRIDGETGLYSSEPYRYGE